MKTNYTLPNTGAGSGMDEEEHEQWLDHTLEVAEKILQVPQDRIYVKQRQRKQGRLGQYQKINEEKEYFTVTEAGLKFLVNLSDYLDTGLFLDHRITRGMVKDECKGKRVLNLLHTPGHLAYMQQQEVHCLQKLLIFLKHTCTGRKNFELNELCRTAIQFYKCRCKAIHPGTETRQLRP